MPSKSRHHRDQRYVLAAEWIRTAATLNPATVCCRDRHNKPCGLRLDEHDGTQHWTAGHTIDGSTTWTLWKIMTEVPPPGDWLAPQASSCNYSSGATNGNRRRRRTHSRRW